MLVALDFDETYTKDPDAWDDVITTLRFYGHDVIIATIRHPYWDAHPLLDHLEEDLNVTTYFTDGLAKRKDLALRGVHPDVWIDDRPSTIDHNSLWSHSSPELMEWRRKNYEKLLEQGYVQYVRDLSEYNEPNTFIPGEKYEPE